MRFKLIDQVMSMRIKYQNLAIRCPNIYFIFFSSNDIDSMAHFPYQILLTF